MEKSPKSLIRLDQLARLNANRDWVNADLYRLMYKEDLYVVAYEKIKSKPGNMTPGVDGETLDGFSLDMIHRIIAEMRSEQFHFKPVRTRYIPKANGKMRKLGIPSTRDKIVQEVLRMILSAIYDSPDGPFFDAHSHGFRPNRSCHSALREIRQTWPATSWFIEGDIEGCFDTIDPAVLVATLRRKIKDERFINLIWKLLRAGEFDVHGQRHDSLIGTPQGGIVSPVLANIYLHELDAKVAEIKARLDRGRGKAASRTYKRLSNTRRRLAQRGQTQSPRFREVAKQMRSIPAVEVNDPNFIRVRYVRYADDWLVGISGPRQLAVEIKEELRRFLSDTLHLTLSAEKTRITSATKDAASFLGVRIRIGTGGQPRTAMVHPIGRIPHRKRTTGHQVRLEAPLDDLIKGLAKDGFCDAHGQPTAKRPWSVLDAPDLLTAYSSKNRGLLNYYRFVDNYARLSRLQYILKFSLAKTLATKHDSTVSKLFKRYGPDLTVSVQRPDGAVTRVGFNANHDWTHQRDAFAVTDSRIDLLTLHISYRTRSHVNSPCCLCASRDRVEMHHVRHLRARTTQLRGFNTLMGALNRKQIPVCKACHGRIHRGDYDGLRLADFAYDPRVHP